ncbi:MarC family protein [Chelativorans sp. J32]|uniref:MarC family protein n=1 Tax=Chelativorans sp. J32 TaxID=935840 RepID=UPI0004876851|nr:MarC family protein [Chelativorans sp. J32]
MNNVINAFFMTYAALFPIINPPGAALIFLNVTRSCEPEVRRKLALRVAASGFLLLICAIFTGSYILAFFGISLSALRLAGGLVITMMGWRLLNGDDNFNDKEPARRDSQNGEMDLAFYPLTLPLTFGPGSIAVAMALGGREPNHLNGLGSAVSQDMGVIAGIGAICLTVYLAYRYAGGLKRVLGRNGGNVLLRLAAFILLCIGVQIVWQGMAGLIQTLPR